MFTGIIQEIGKVKDIHRVGNVYRLSIISEKLPKETKIGDSIAINGVCLTAVETRHSDLVFEVMDESIRKSNLGRLKRGASINMEPSLKLGDKLSGHMLSGHIDTTGRIRRIIKEKANSKFIIAYPPQFKRYIKPKGSIALDGVSLTVGEVGSDWFSVYIIPHTLKYSRLGFVKVGDAVNIEVDILAKYAQK